MDNQTMSENQRLEVLASLSHLLIGKGWDELKKEITLIVDESINKAISSNNHPLEDEYFDRKQAAVFLKCCETKLYYLLKEGNLPHYKIGRRTLFKKSELLEHFKKDNAKRRK